MRDGSLTPREFQAAVAYRTDAELAISSAVHAIALDGTGRAPGYRTAKLERCEALHDALARLAAVRQRLGAAIELEALVVEDLSWPAIGRQMCVDHKPARHWAVTAIKALAAAW